MEIIQRPEQITVIYEAHNEVRRLYFGAKVIAESDCVPDRNGYSVAHGATLVVSNMLTRHKKKKKKKTRIAQDGAEKLYDGDCPAPGDWSDRVE